MKNLFMHIAGNDLSVIFVGAAFVLASTICEAQIQEQKDDEEPKTEAQTGSQESSPDEQDGPAEKEGGVDEEKEAEIDPDSKVEQEANQQNSDTVDDKQNETEEQGDPVKAGGEKDKECIPKCRAQYVCIDGECKGACNPPCRASELCTKKGHCVPTEPEQTVDLGVSLIRQQQPFYDARHQKFNMMKYDEFQKKKVNGVVLIITGVTTMLTGIVMMTSRLARYGDTDEGKPAKVIGWSAQAVGGLLLVGGIVVNGKSKKGMERAEAGFFDPEPDIVECVEPDSLKSSVNKNSRGAGFSLGFRF